MEETVFMNDQQPVENAVDKKNSSKDSNKKKVWRQVAIGGVTGVVFGAASTTAYAAVPNEEDVETAEEGEATTEESTVQSYGDGSIPIAEVSDDMTFGEAFAAARHQVGAGGVFVWRGEVYGTYTAEEWNSMTPDEHAAFGNHLNIVYEETPSTTPMEPVVTPVEPVVTHEEPLVTTQESVVTPEEPVAAVVNQEPTVEVIAYETVQNADGSNSDIAVVSIDGQETGLYDIDQDGIADLAAVDLNHDNQITENEVGDVSDMGIAMQPLQDDYLAQQDIAMNTSDYINDGNVDSYMA